MHLYAHMCRKQWRNLRYCSSGAMHLVLWDLRSLIWARLPSQWALWIHASLPPQCWDYKCVLLHPAFFMRVPEIELLSSHLHSHIPQHSNEALLTVEQTPRNFYHCYENLTHRLGAHHFSMSGRTREMKWPLGARHHKERAQTLQPWPSSTFSSVPPHY